MRQYALFALFTCLFFSFLYSILLTFFLRCSLSLSVSPSFRLFSFPSPFSPLALSLSYARTYSVALSDIMKLQPAKTNGLTAMIHNVSSVNMCLTRALFSFNLVSWSVSAQHSLSIYYCHSMACLFITILMAIALFVVNSACQ